MENISHPKLFLRRPFGREVVRVTYDPQAISMAELVENGARARCADAVFTDDGRQQKQAAKVVGSGKVQATSAYRPDRDNKYYLAHTHYRAVPMTPLQAARANALIGEGRSPESVLSPRQCDLARRYARLPEKEWPNRIGVVLADFGDGKR